jgi:hypothetical protein
MPRATTVDQDVLSAVRRLTGKDEGGDGEGFALRSEIEKEMPGVDIRAALGRLEAAHKLIHSVYGYSLPTGRRRP